MNYQQAQEAGYLITEQENQAIQRLIIDQYNQAYREIDARIAKLYAKFSDAAKSGSVSQSDLYNWSIQYDRLGKLQEQIAEVYTEHYKNIETLQIEASSLSMTNNYYRQQFMLTWEAPELSFSMLNPHLVEVSVMGQVSAWSDIPKAAQLRYGNIASWSPTTGTLSNLIAGNRADEIKKIQRAINSGLISGDSYSKVARNIRDVIGEVTGDQSSGAMASALRIARTEGNRAMNAGNYANACDAAAQGLDITRTWLATLDSGTRPAHARMDGKTTTIDKPFKFPEGWTAMYPGTIRTGNYKLDASQNIGCRCTTFETVGEFVPTARRGRNPVTGEDEVFEYKQFDKWAEGHGLERNKYGQLYKE